jgi:hypothetical protein
MERLITIVPYLLFSYPLTPTVLFMKGLRASMGDLYSTQRLPKGYPNIPFNFISTEFYPDMKMALRYHKNLFQSTSLLLPTPVNYC